MKTKRMRAPEDWRDLKPHPLAELVPYGAGIDTAQMVEHMSEHGYDDGEPVILIERSGVLEILDGRHKQVSAQEADVTPTFALFIGGDPLPFIKKKLHRQHLNESQRSMFAAKLIELSTKDISNSAAEKAGPKSGAANLQRKPPTQKEAGAMMNVSERSVADAVKVTKEGGAKLQEQVANGQLGVSAAANLLRSVFCPRCKRCGPQRNCARCQEFQAKTALAAQKKTSKPKKPGSEKFNWKEYDQFYGRWIRGIDELKRAYPEVAKTEEFAEIERLRDEYGETWNKLRAMVTKIKD
jgi:hypothetical protein